MGKFGKIFQLHRVLLLHKGSLYSRLARSFLLLVSILTAVELFLFYTFWTSYQEIVIQQLSWDLASDFAKELEPLLKNFSPKEAQKELYRLSKLSPGVDPYLLDQSGNVLVHLAPFDVGPLSPQDLERFLNHRGPLNAPLTIAYPATAHPDLRKKIFSVAPIQYGEKKGYLFLGLEGGRRELMNGSFGDTYLFHFSIIVLLLSVAATMLLGLFVFYFLTRNFHLLSRAMEEVEQGNYERRVDVSGDDEVARAARAFNSMVSSLVSALERIRQTDNQRRELLSNVTHDIRRPITSTQLKLQTFLHAPRGEMDPQDRQTLEGILKGFHGVQTLIDDLFDLAKLDAEEIQPKVTRFSAQELIEEIFDELDPGASRRNVRLALRVLAKDQEIYSDRDLLHRLLSNLIENAILYSHEGTEVVVEISEISENLKLAIIDKGIGISPNDLPHIFERFYRSTKARESNSAGSGLGLAISKRIADTLGVELTVQSIVEQGTRFEISLS